MRGRVPSPALVIASIALFLALAGTAAATEFAILRTGHPTRLVSGSVSADGTVTGARLTGARQSTGVYTVIISGYTFATHKTFAPGQTTVSPLVLEGYLTSDGRRINVPPRCDVASQHIALNGSAKVEVDCFTYDAKTGWIPTDASFDFVMLGPAR